jgi:rubrerythrin
MGRGDMEIYRTADTPGVHEAAAIARIEKRAKAEHRKQLMKLRNQLNEELGAATTASNHVLASARNTADLIAKSKAVIEEGQALQMAHEQIQGSATGRITVVPKVDVSGNDPQMQTLKQPGNTKPAVTAEQYARGREVLDALPPGVYLKCSSCHLWQMGGDIAFRGGGGFLCEKCA